MTRGGNLPPITSPVEGSPRTARGLRLAVTLVSIGALVIGVLFVTALIFWVLPTLSSVSRRAESRSQLAAVAAALRAYAETSGGWIEPGATDWGTRLVAAGLLTPDQLRAPEAPSGTWSYVYIPPPPQSPPGFVVLVQPPGISPWPETFVSRLNGDVDTIADEFAEHVIATYTPGGGALIGPTAP